MTPEMRLNPFPMYAMMRQNGGFLRMEEHKACHIFRYDDVKAVLSDHARFSSDIPIPSPDYEPTLLAMDPPRHTHIRNVVNRGFTPRALANLEPRIAKITNEMLDEVHKQEGRMDLIADLAVPVPVMVLAELMGVPPSDRAKLKYWTEQVIANSDTVLTTGITPEFAATMAEVIDYFGNIIAKRRRQPEDDLISALLAAEEGEQLRARDVFNFLRLLLVAGNETSTNMIGNAVLCLLEHPDQMARLRQNPDLLPSAVEETLRYRSPVQAVFRHAIVDAEVGGFHIPAGDRVIIWLGSANHDETRFDSPERLDIGRNPNPHIAFSHGIHFCLGTPLARMEARVVLGAVLEHFSHLERVDSSPLEPVKGFVLHGVRSLPLVFTEAGSRR